MKARRSALLMLIGALLGLWTAWATLILPSLEPAQGLQGEVRGLLVRSVLWVLPCGVYLWSQHRRNWWRPLRLWLPPRGPRTYVAVMIVLMATLAISLNVARELELSVLDVWRRWQASYSLEFPATPLFEEMVFRGVVFSELLWLLAASAESIDDTPRQRSLKRWRAAWSANLLASVVFVGAHWPYWIYVDGIGFALLHRSVPILLLSLVLGMLFARSSSIWPCVLLHWINNELSGLLVAP